MSDIIPPSKSHDSDDIFASRNGAKCFEAAFFGGVRDLVKHNVFALLNREQQVQELQPYAVNAMLKGYTKAEDNVYT